MSDDPSSGNLPPVRRKRGMSLRSQLFARLMQQPQNPSSDDHPTPPSTTQATPPPPPSVPETPKILVSTAAENSEPIELNSLDFVNNSLDCVNNADDGSSPPDYHDTTHLPRSTSLFLVASNNLGQPLFGPRRHRRPPSWLQRLTRLKNKITGNTTIPPSDNGRLIPITTNLSLVNQDFGEPFYNPSTKELIDDRTGDRYVDNTITLSKYTVWTFLPKQIKAQFSKLANCYFMVVAIMQMIPTWLTTGQYTTIVPLLIFMLISILREGFDDWKRHSQDKEENSKKSTVIREDGEMATLDTQLITAIVTEMELPLDEFSSDTLFMNDELMRRYNLKHYPKRWKDIKVGDILELHENEWIPADLVLLLTLNLEQQEAFVETMALDGETNLKPRVPHPELAQLYSLVQGLKNSRVQMAVEDPNLDLYNFEGQFEVNGEKYALGPENVLYRGCILRNTQKVLGVVIFTGEETKIRMNNIRNPRTKAPKLQKNINYIVLFMICVVVLLLAFLTMGQRLEYNKWIKTDRLWYMFGEDAGVAPTLMGYIIMYNTLIPLSLYVTMEFIKLMQLVLLQWDIDMYHVSTNTPAEGKTATILEELGQVLYIFSDKTGTLTDNQMLFRKFSVGGTSWLHDLDYIQKQRDDPTYEAAPMMPLWNADLKFLTRASFEPAPAPRTSMATIARQLMDLVRAHTNDLARVKTYKLTANPNRPQVMNNSLQLLRYLQLSPQTLFAKKASFFLLLIAICTTCLPRRVAPDKNEDDMVDNSDDDGDIQYQGALPDELALVQAARDLGYVVFSKQQNTVVIKTYPRGFDQPAKFEEYQILEVIEFSLARKRMLVVVRFPDGRIGVISKGADNVILERLKQADLAQQKVKELSQATRERQAEEAEVVLRTKKLLEATELPRPSLSGIRRLMQAHANQVLERMGLIDNALADEEIEINDIAFKLRKLLHLQQAKKYNLESQDGPSDISSGSLVPPDRLLVNDEFIIEKTIEHIDEFSLEGLRTLLYLFKWVDKQEYEEWLAEYRIARTALNDRLAKVESVGAKLEQSGFDLLGATAIEDKLQDGVADAIEKLRRAGIKMWMLTGDKRETAINIGYLCRLIKDYSTVVIILNDGTPEEMMNRITLAIHEIVAGTVAHCVCVIDGGTLADIEKDPSMLSLLLDFCEKADSTICCRALPSQKANMVSSIRKLKPKCVTLAIGDGANDIAMIQQADIGVGITGKEGLQAARSLDYAIAQFRYLLKLLLVHGRYNYVRTLKFVLGTFYKEIMFYLTQCIYQRNTLWLGLSMYELWSLSMFNTLFTSLPVLCIGMFDQDLHPATILAVPELYNKGRLYQGFNLKLFIQWMVLGTAQLVGIAFMAFYLWGFSALKDNSTLPLGTLCYSALVIVINAKCTLIEMQNRTWLAFALFGISVGGYALWNLLIMGLYRTKQSSIFFVDYGLYHFGLDGAWWATILVAFVVPLLADILLKVLKFMISPADDELFKLFERDVTLRKMFEIKAWPELCQGWTFPKEALPWLVKFVQWLQLLGFSVKDPRVKMAEKNEQIHQNQVEFVREEEDGLRLVLSRKRAGTNPLEHELAPSGSGIGASALFQSPHIARHGNYEILPLGKRVRFKKSDSAFSTIAHRLMGRQVEDIDAIIDQRLRTLDG